jgi:hypothetical protein
MSEPLVLHKPDGVTINVYTRSQAEAMIAAGEWFATAADAKARKVRTEPTPAIDGKLDALETVGSVVTDDTVMADPTPSPAPRKTSKGVKGKL